MGQLFEYIKMSIRNIRSNKGRSILTMLGIIIGISSVIMIVSVGNGVSKQVNEELDDMAGGQMVFYSAANNGHMAVEFSPEDLEALMGKVDHVKGVSPSFGDYGTVLSPKGDFTAEITAGNEMSVYENGKPFIEGEYFTKSDVEKFATVCVINKSSAKKMFGTTDIIGRTIEVTLGTDVREYEIIGVRDEKEKGGLLGDDKNENVKLSIPMTTYARSYKMENRLSKISNFMVYSEGALYSKDVAKDCIKLLEGRYDIRGKEVIKVENFDDFTSEIKTMTGTLTIFIVLVAAISLLVGGIGVMNIMLVSVTERTREIGIRKALGARTFSILTQFLSESAIITLIGGIIGILIGIVGASIIGYFAKVTPEVSAMSVFLATVFSSGVGLFFGIYPANRAAKLKPIEALRHD